MYYIILRPGEYALSKYIGEYVIMYPSDDINNSVFRQSLPDFLVSLPCKYKLHEVLDWLQEHNYTEIPTFCKTIEEVITAYPEYSI